MWNVIRKLLTIFKLGKMKKKNLVKFNEFEIEVLSSESELAAINGGGKGSVALEIFKILLGGGININGNCGCK